MNNENNVANVIPAWGSEGLTFQEICSKLPDVNETEISFILEDFDRKRLIEVLTFRPGVPKYRCAKGVK